MAPKSDRIIRWITVAPGACDQEQSLLITEVYLVIFRHFQDARQVIAPARLLSNAFCQSFRGAGLAAIKDQERLWCGTGCLLQHCGPLSTPKEAGKVTIQPSPLFRRERGRRRNKWNQCRS